MSSNFVLILRDFVPAYLHAKFCGNWTTNKGKTWYMVPKDPSLNRVNRLFQDGASAGTVSADPFCSKTLSNAKEWTLFYNIMTFGHIKIF